MPDEKKAKEILDEIHFYHGQDKDEGWINHQLYQVLNMNLEGKALNMIKNVETVRESMECWGGASFCRIVLL